MIPYREDTQRGLKGRWDEREEGIRKPGSRSTRGGTSGSGAGRRAPARWIYERAGRAGGGRRVLTALAVLVVLEVVR